MQLSFWKQIVSNAVTSIGFQKISNRLQHLRKPIALFINDTKSQDKNKINFRQNPKFHQQFCDITVFKALYF